MWPLQNLGKNTLRGAIVELSAAGRQPRRRAERSLFKKDAKHFFDTQKAAEPLVLRPPRVFPISSQPDGPVSIGKGSAAVAQLSLRLQLAEGVPHTEDDLGLDVQRVVGGEYPPDGQCGDFLQGG